MSIDYSEIICTAVDEIITAKFTEHPSSLMETK